MKLLLPILLLAGMGCGYLSNRGEDFLDSWRVEGKAGLPGAWVKAGPVAHVGLGTSEGGLTWTGGFKYNYLSPEGDRLQSTTGNVHFSGPTDMYYLVHMSYGGYGDPDHHQCFALLPPLLNKEGIHKNWLHDFDVEVGASAFLGVSVGFSAGEFLDFLLGWFLIDIGGDDTEDGRANRAYFSDTAGILRPDLPVRDEAPD